VRAVRAEAILLEGLKLPLEAASGQLLQLGEVKGEGGWSPFLVEEGRLKCIALSGPRWARGAAAAAILLRLYAEGLRFTAIDTGRRLRSLLSSSLPIDLYRVGVDSTFNPFAVERGWSLEDSCFYASLASKAFIHYAGLTKAHAHLLESALSSILEDEPQPSPMEVAQGLEAQLDPASTRHRAIEELKASLLALEHGYAASSFTSPSFRPVEVRPLKPTVVELSYLPTAELRCFYQACLLAKLVVEARRSKLGDAAILIEDCHVLLRAQPWSFEDLLAPLIYEGLRLILAAPSVQAMAIPEATLTLVAEGGGEALRAGGLEVKLDYPSWSLAPLSDADLERLAEARMGAPIARLKPSRRLKLTTLEELFIKDEVRQKVREALSYLRDSYSTFKALLELMSPLGREEARRALIRMYRHGLIAQREVNGVKVVALTDLGRLVLEEYESKVEGGGCEGGAV
jgi:hypothetical protein